MLSCGQETKYRPTGSRLASTLGLGVPAPFLSPCYEHGGRGLRQRSSPLPLAPTDCSRIWFHLLVLRPMIKSLSPWAVKRSWAPWSFPLVSSHFPVPTSRQRKGPPQARVLCCGSHLSHPRQQPLHTCHTSALLPHGQTVFAPLASHLPAGSGSQAEFLSQSETLLSPTGVRFLEVWSPVLENCHLCESVRRKTTSPIGAVML